MDPLQSVPDVTVCITENTCWQIFLSQYIYCKYIYVMLDGLDSRCKHFWHQFISERVMRKTQYALRQDVSDLHHQNQH